MRGSGVQVTLAAPFSFFLFVRKIAESGGGEFSLRLFTDLVAAGPTLTCENPVLLIPLQNRRRLYPEVKFTLRSC